MMRSDAPEFFTRKVVSMTWPFATVPASLVSGMTSILGAPTAFEAAADFAGALAGGGTGAFAAWASSVPTVTAVARAKQAN